MCPALAFTLRRRISTFDVRVTVCVNVYVNTGIDLATGSALDLIGERKQKTGFIADLKEASDATGCEDQED